MYLTSIQILFLLWLNNHTHTHTQKSTHNKTKQTKQSKKKQNQTPKQQEAHQLAHEIYIILAMWIINHVNKQRSPTFTDPFSYSDPCSKCRKETMKIFTVAHGLYILMFKIHRLLCNRCHTAGGVSFEMHFCITNADKKRFQFFCHKLTEDSKMQEQISSSLLFQTIILNNSPRQCNFLEQILHALERKS